MPRVGRKSAGGIVYHVLNRGNGRARLFHKSADYAAFLKILREVKDVVPVRVLGYCLMPNHWHLLLWPKGDGDLSRFMQRLTTTHVRRLHAHQDDTAGGHVYQGRFKSFPVQDDSHLLTVLRYVEANPFRKHPEARARDWRWSSLCERSTSPDDSLLDGLPLPLPADWERIVAQRWSKEELAAVREGVIRGRPFGSDKWVAAIAKKLNLGFTMRPRGRPRKAEGDRAK